MRIPKLTVKKVAVSLLASAFILTMPVDHDSKEVPAVNKINHYETPCQTAARETYGVPLFNDAHAQWQRDHLNTPEGHAYNEAAAACPQPAKWDFDSMILVGIE